MKKYRKSVAIILNKLLGSILLVAMFLSVSIPVMAQNTAPKREIVKAGFFAWDGYHMKDDNGIYSGYGYDFLKMAETYNNWQFDFVGYDKSWADMLTMLDDGQIDLVTSAQKTPEWEAKYDYSSSPIGTSSTILTVRADDTRYVIGDSASYDGMVIGCLSESSRNQKFADFALMKGFSYTPVYYSDFSELENALKEKKVDGILSTNLRTTNGEIVLEELDPVDYYVIVKRGNQELLDKINYAINEMDMNTPSWKNTLKDKYYSRDEQEELVFNKEELDYLSQLKENNTILKVATNPDLAPYSSYDKNGTAVGIAPKIFEEIAKQTGIQYQYVQFQTYEEYNQYIREGKADIDLTCFSDYGLAADHEIRLTNPYMKTTLAMLSKDTFNGNVRSIAELDAVENNTIYSDDLLTNISSKKYNTHAQCIQSVLDGNVDATYLYTYTAQKAVEEDARNRLIYRIMPEYEINIAFGVNEGEDYRLVSILNEGIHGLEGSFIQHAIQDEVSDIEEKDNLISLIYDYPEVALSLFGIILIIIFIFIFLGIREGNERKQHLQSLELARFMGYVCEANETVMEVNLNSMTCKKHNMENGVLVSEEFPYSLTSFQNQDNVIEPSDFKKLISDKEMQKFYENLSQTHEQIYFEARAKDKNGEYRWYSYTIRGIPKSKNHPNNFVLFKKKIDATVRKSEEQKQALENALTVAKNASMAKGQFLSKMSHEIRTPLNAVIGYMQIAMDSGDNVSKMMHCIENGEMAAKHLLSIINDVLDISSIESGKMKIANEDFNLKQQIKTISTLFYNQAREKNIDFEISIEQITQEWIVGDSLRLNQILMNLLSNAIKFTPENGSILLKIFESAIDEQHTKITFSVSDTGIGMSKEYRNRLFQPFEQESATTARKYGGTGLGLSITNNLVQMMGGSIEVESEQNKGSNFTISLQFKKSHKQKEIDDLKDSYSKIRVIFVEENNEFSKTIKSLLKNCKVKCDVVRNQEAAIRQIQGRMGTEYMYDLCLLDLNMQNVNWVGLTDQIKELCMDEKPAFAAFAYDMTEVEEIVTESHISKVIQKPIFHSDVLGLLGTLFGDYHPVSRNEEKLESIKGLHVLLAEDNEMNMEIAMEILQKAGIIVDAVKDGKQAVDKFLEQPKDMYDAVLMDVQMPVMDGYTATKEIRRANHPRAKTIPIIAMTANAFAEDVNAALDNGMNGHITKPIDYSKLYAALNEFCK